MMTVFPELMDSRLSLWYSAHTANSISMASTHIGYASFGQMEYKVYETPVMHKVYETPVMRVITGVDSTRVHPGNPPGLGWTRVYREKDWPLEARRWNLSYCRVGSMYMLGAYLYPDLMEMLSYVSGFNNRDLMVCDLQRQLIGQASYGAIVWSGGVP